MSWRSSYLWPVLALVIIIAGGGGIVVFLQNKLQTDTNGAQELAQSAAQLVQNKEYTLALTKIGEGIRLNPKNADLYSLAIDIYRIKKQSQLALQTAAQGATVTQSDTVRQKYIDLLLEQGLYDQAETQMGKLKSLGDQPRNEYGARLALYRGDTAKAQEYIDKFRADVASEDSALWKVLTHASDPTFVGEQVKALTALSATPTAVAWQVFLRDYQQVATNDEAKHLYLRTIVARMAYNAGYDAVAQQLAEGVTADAPNYEQAWLVVGQAALRRKDTEKGLAALNKVIEINTNLPEPYWYRARHWLTAQDQKQAQADYESAIANADNKNPALLVEWARQQKAWQQDPSKTYSTIIALSKPDTVVLISAYAELGSYQIAQNKKTAANTTINKGLLDKRISKVLSDHSLDTSPLHCSLIELHLANNEVAKARAIIDQNQEVYAQSACFHYWFGRELQAENNTDQAKKEFQKAFDIDIEGAIAKRVDDEKLL